MYILAALACLVSSSLQNYRRIPGEFQEYPESSCFSRSFPRSWKEIIKFPELSKNSRSSANPDIINGCWGLGYRGGNVTKFQKSTGDKLKAATLNKLGDKLNKALMKNARSWSKATSLFSFFFFF